MIGGKAGPYRRQDSLLNNPRESTMNTLRRTLALTGLAVVLAFGAAQSIHALTAHSGSATTAGKDITIVVPDGKEGDIEWP